MIEKKTEWNNVNQPCASFSGLLLSSSTDPCRENSEALGPYSLTAQYGLSN